MSYHARKDTPEAREFWANVDRVAAEVDKWPAWKRGFIADDTKDADMTEMDKPIRFRKALVDVTDDAIGVEFPSRMGRWFNNNRGLLIRGGDEEGLSRFNYEITSVEDVCDELAPLRKALMARYESAAETCEVPPFEVDSIEINATLYFHGSHFVWHDDALGYTQEFIPSRRLTFCYYLHSDPKMFQGGELELNDGTLVEPQNDRLVLFHPLQRHRVRAVECFSNDAMHGRWALVGWLHGKAPEGYTYTK